MAQPAGAPDGQRPGPAGRSARLGRRSWVVVPLATAVVSRLFSILITELIAAVVEKPRPHLLTMWDGQWYLRIARDGYHAAVNHGGHDFAFFPGWPMVIRVGSLGGALPADFASVVVANLLFIVALVAIWRLLADRMDAGVATSAAMLLALSPPAYVFSLAYSESLFLLIAALFYLARPGSRWRVPLAVVAMLTRVAGMAVVASSAVQALRTRGRERHIAVAAAIGGLAAFAAWWTFIAVLTGDPMGYLLGSPGWVHRSVMAAIRSTLHLRPFALLAWAGFFGTMVVGTALLYRRDRELTVYAAAVLAVGLIPVLAGGILHSLPRYDVVAFPAFAGLADRLGRRGSAALVIVFLLGQVVFLGWAIPAAGGMPP